MAQNLPDSLIRLTRILSDLMTSPPVDFQTYSILPDLVGLYPLRTRPNPIYLTNLLFALSKTVSCSGFQISIYWKSELGPRFFSQKYYYEYIIIIIYIII